MTGPTEKLLAFFARCHWLLQWLIISSLGLALYAPVLGNSFVNDDFFVLNKVCLDRQLNTEGFFRPLTDITLFGNYLLGGLNPLGFYVTNVLLHALNVLFLFIFCYRWKIFTDNRQQLLLAGLAALFFLTYPFHNESVVWILGRASSLSASFAFLALVILVSNWREHWKITAVACCYFVGTTAYESALVLPAIIFAWMLAKRVPAKVILAWMSVLTLVLIAHFIVRIWVSGSVTGEYGARLLGWDPALLVGKLAKVAGRLVVPPIKNPVVFSMLAVLFYIFILITGWRFWKKYGANKDIRRYVLALAFMVITALLLPFAIGVSTNSSENDRFLYLPSFFITIMVAFLLVNGLYRSKWLIWVATAIIAYSIIFLQLNNRNWTQASQAVTSLLQILKDKPADGDTYVVNLPDENNGAFIFRVGFRDALVINRVDTSSVVLVNRAIMRELEKLPGIVPQPQDGALFIPPAVIVHRSTDGTDFGGDKYKSIYISERDRVVYWNARRWVILPRAAPGE